MRKMWNKIDSDVIESAIKLLAASRVTMMRLRELHQPLSYIGLCAECFTEYPCKTIQTMKESDPEFEDWTPDFTEKVDEIL